MQKITPFLWFDNKAEEAMNFYISVFNGSPAKKAESKIVDIMYYPEKTDEEHLKNMQGKVLTGVFELEGQRFMCLDGGPVFKPSAAISFLVECENQQEIDYFWEKLTEGGDSNNQQCGWLSDKYGFAWQIIPKNMGDLIKNEKAMHEMMQMKKIDIATLEKASK